MNNSVPTAALGAAGTLQPLITEYVLGRVRRGELVKSTAAGYWSTLVVLAAMHGARPVAQFGKATVERWLEATEALAPSTRRTQWSYVSKFSDYLVEKKIIRANPCLSMRAPRRPRTVPRALDGDAVTKLLVNAPDTRATAVIWLEVGLALRRIEVSRLKIEDWSRRDEVVRVTGKGGHERYVPVPKSAAAALDAYLTEWPATVGPLIRSYTTGRALSVSTLSHYMAEWMTAAGVKHAARDGVSGHALRHTAATDVLDQCGDLRAVQELLGHAHLSSTSIYVGRSMLNELRAAMEGRRYAS